jgi:drug/metabolite transporter (DMT)-like permease
VTWQWLLKTAEATALSFVALITPITAVILGASLGNERFDAVDLVGAAIVLAGIYVSISRRLAVLGRSVAGRASPASDPADPPGRQD